MIDRMLSAWNSRDDAKLREIVDASLTTDVVFCDPPHNITGHDALIAMVHAFWKDNGACTIARSSAVDSHHDRARYTWAITFPDGRKFEGMDAVALDLEAGKVRRIDGFFGPMRPL
jgi:hypothetical protein